ncbi:hypothetical protein [Variovorax atrisoli]|uniref:hypothetical protein n=1 Tax=Variovorax atrisoli TaxID=3394203 RepID=UPI00035D1ACC|nr:hypothetical protein [Variovorax paradoxus]
MPKAVRTAEQLQQMLIERIEAIPDLRGQETDVHRGGVVGTGVSGDDGPSWTVPIVSDRGTHRADIARIIRTLQSQFDLED